MNQAVQQGGEHVQTTCQLGARSLLVRPTLLLSGPSCSSVGNPMPYMRCSRKSAALFLKQCPDDQGTRRHITLQTEGELRATSKPPCCPAVDGKAAPEGCSGSCRGGTHYDFSQGPGLHAGPALLWSRAVGRQGKLSQPTVTQPYCPLCTLLQCAHQWGTGRPA